MMGVVGSNLTIFKLEPTTPNLLAHVATRRKKHTCCAQQCGMLRCQRLLVLYRLPGYKNVNFV